MTLSQSMVDRVSTDLDDAASQRISQVAQKLSDVRQVEIEMSTLIRAMQRQVHQLETLSEVSSLLNSTLEPEEVRRKSLEATCALLQCETATLYLIDEARGDLFFETALGEIGEALKQTLRLPIDNRSIAGSVAMTGEPVLTNDVAGDTRFNRKATSRTGFETRNMVAVPLRVKGKTLGVLQAINKRRGPFVGADLRILSTLAHQVAIAVDNAHLVSKIKTSFYQTVEALVEAVEKKDSVTGGHTKRVVFFCSGIGEELSLPSGELERLRMAAVLHDVGKIGIEDKILKKGAPLDEYEWPVMKEHPELGFQIMKRVEMFKDVMDGMRFHHERWDGKGYPKGLRGEEIPLVARIVAVADTYDAMVSTRPYRKGLEPKVAYEEILRNRGTQFCPVVVDAFARAFQAGRLGRR